MGLERAEMTGLRGYWHVPMHNLDITPEELYQDFKERLMAEVVAKQPDEYVDKWDGLIHRQIGISLPLVDKEQK